MNFTGELTVWIVGCILGLITASLSFRYAWLNNRAVNLRNGNIDVRNGTSHFREQAFGLAVFWLGFLVAGVAAALDDAPPERPLGTTVFGLILRYTLIGSMLLLSYLTAKNYLYGRRRWAKIRSERLAQD